MGRIVTPKYRVEYATNALVMRKVHADGLSTAGRPSEKKPVHIQAWSGRANEIALARWRLAMNKSFLTGGANAHVSEALGMVEHIHWAQIVRQRDSAVMCVVRAPAFEIVE